MQTTLLPTRTLLILLCCSDKELVFMHVLSNEPTLTPKDRLFTLYCRKQNAFFEVVFGQLRAFFVCFFDSVEESPSLPQTNPPLLRSKVAFPRCRVYTVISKRMFHREPDDEIMVQLNQVYIYKLWDVLPYWILVTVGRPTAHSVNRAASRGLRLAGDSSQGLQGGQTQQKTQVTVFYREDTHGMKHRFPARSPFLLIYCDSYTVGGKCTVVYFLITAFHMWILQATVMMWSDVVSSRTLDFSSF